MEATPARDLPAILALGLPVGSLALCLAFALVDHEAYDRVILAHERGYLEHTTVLMLVPAVVMLLWIAWSGARAPGAIGRSWALVVALGALYFAGEEASWGQNYFGWETPEAWIDVNTQQETNIHNVHGIFDQTPRALLTGAAFVAAVLPFVLRRRRRGWSVLRDWPEAVLPTLATTPIALVALLVGLPQRIYKLMVGSEAAYGAYDPSVHPGIDMMFLRGNHSELKEHFLGMFIFVYALSWTWRVVTARRGSA